MGSLGPFLGASPAAPSSKARLDQLGEGAAAMADRVLLRRRHLGVGARLAGRLEAGIVAVAAAAARRPDDATVEHAVHQLDMLVGPGERQRAMEGGAARRVGVGHAALGELVLD